jgi:hypothetical protein
MTSSPTTTRLAPRRAVRGAALLPAILIALLVMTTSAAMTSNALHRYTAERVRGERELALHVAESGADVALYEVQSGADLAKDGIGVASGAVEGGRYSTTIAPAYAGPGTYTITSSGTVGGATQLVDMVVVSKTDVGDGLIGLAKLTMNGTPLIDSYDSTVGSYASQVKGGHAGSQGNVASNGDVSTSGSGTVFGDATPGPGGVYSGGFSVTGSTAPAAKPITFDAYVYSPPSPAKKSWSGSGTLNAGTYHYTSLTLKSKDVLTLKGAVTIYVDGAIDLSGSSSIVVASGAKVVVNHGAKTLSIGGGGIVNNTQSPAALEIYSATTGAVTISGTSAFYGVVDAPYASFTKNGTADYYGSILAGSAKVSGTGGVHYDVSLATGGATTFQVVLVRGR